jgi:acyl-lipid omega-6 desaturase (Delta-12 desaturase)
MRKITEAEKIEIAKRLREFQTPSDLKSYMVVIGNLLGLTACLIGNYYLYQIHPLFTVPLWIPTVAFFVRSAIGMHDCGHKSMFSTKRQNMIVGRICGMVITTFIIR